MEPDRFYFPTNFEGVEACVRTRNACEQFGCTCTEEREVIGTTELLVLVSVPPERPNRKERGCYL